DVLPEPDSVVDPGVIRSAGERRRQRQTSAEQHPLGLAVAHDLNAFKMMRERRGAGEEGEEPLLDVWGQAVVEVEVEHRAVERGDAGAEGDGVVERRDVAESDDGTRVAT